jgi:endonuclease/exonuclease/phosphatase (EEP) superfamily protein YafD
MSMTGTALRVLSWLAALALGLVTAASFLGGLWWAFDLAAHFRPQLALLSLAAAIVAAIARAPVPSAVLLASVVANAAPLMPRLAGAVEMACAGTARDATRDSTGDMRVLALNLHGRSTDPAAFRRLIEAERPDIVLLTELPRDLGPLTADLPALPVHRLIDQRGSGFDLALFSRWPFAFWQLDRGDGGGLPVLAADICPAAGSNDGACLRIVGVHAARPLEAQAQPQDEQLDRAAHLAAQAPAGGVVLLGDLNLTPWSPRFRELLDDAGLRDASMQLPFEPTWRAPLPFLGLAIDHVLTSPGLAVTCSRTGADVGSDHLPVIADVAMGEAAIAPAP